MLAHARRRVPGAAFLLGDLHRLPLPDDAVDLAVCALALTHLPDLGPAIAEFARVLRPGGHLVLSDIHPECVLRGTAPTQRGPDGRPGRLPAHHHRTGDYLRAAFAAGLRPLACVEPTSEQPVRPATNTLGQWEVWPWVLTDLVPEAAHAANAGVPAMLVWDFQLT